MNLFPGQGIIDEESLNIFTDGSSYPDKKRNAGVGVVLVWVNENGNEVTETYAPPGWESATVDEMEIKACSVAIDEGLRIFKQDISRFKRILVFSDSMYVVSNFYNAMHVWPKTKWRLNNGMPAANIPLWRELKKEITKSPIPVSLEWVKGHKKNNHNKSADKLAKQSSQTPIQKKLSNSETTRKWSDRKTKRGCIPIKGQETCIRIVSREYLTKAKTNEYRYEIIDPDDSHYKDLDFVFCKTNLSRAQCLKVRLNTDASVPTIVEIIEELVADDYKY